MTTKGIFKNIEVKKKRDAHKLINTLEKARHEKERQRGSKGLDPPKLIERQLCAPVLRFYIEEDGTILPDIKLGSQ